MSRYYTADELISKTDELIKAGKQITALADDPKCPPEERAKLKALRKLSEKGGLRS
jgi:hypothetical protein